MHNRTYNEADWIRISHRGARSRRIAQSRKTSPKACGLTHAVAAMLAAAPTVLEQEKGFELPLANNVILIGRMDQVNSLGRNDVEIVDYKTGKPKKEVDANKSLQLSIYALAAREIFEWNPVRLVFYYLLNNSFQVTTRDAKQIAAAEKIIQETAADIRGREFAAKPGYACRTCAYQPICPAPEESLTSDR